MPLLAYGINHQSAPIEIREKLTFNPQQLSDALQSLAKQTAVEEAVILSTCHRTEIYAHLSAYFPLQQWLQNQKSLKPNTLNPYDYAYHDIEAVQHLMRVASGLDSMILGEPQVFGQMKQAYQVAEEVGTVGPLLQRLFPAVFESSKHIRTNTDICTHPVSLAYAITQLLETHYGSLTDHHALLIGAGETIKLIATHLHQHGLQQLSIANRTRTHAERIANPIQAEVISLSEIAEKLKQVDIVISATGSHSPMITRNMVEEALLQRDHRPLFLMDLALPRDIDFEIASLTSVTLYNIDDLQQIIANNIQHRQQAALQAESFIELHANEFMRNQRIHHAHDIIADFRHHMESLRDSELQKALHQLELGHDPHTVMTQFGRSLVNKIIHQPTLKLREAASDLQTETLQAAKVLFELE